MNIRKLPEDAGWCGDRSRGAGMGRSDTLPANPMAPIELYVQRLSWVDGDYDEGGAYWGIGAMNGKKPTYIYWAQGEDAEDCIDVFVRAISLEAAKEAIITVIAPHCSGVTWFEPEDEPEGLTDFFDAYVEAALFYSTYEPEPDMNEGIQLSQDFCRVDIHPLTLAAMRKDCIAFLSANAKDIGTSYDEAGNDFWLTRSRSGAGFGDGDWQPRELDKRLYKAAQTYREFELYVGDDGVIYAGGHEPPLTPEQMATFAEADRKASDDMKAVMGGFIPLKGA